MADETHYTHMETTFGGRIGFAKCSCGWRGPNRGYDDGLNYHDATDDDANDHKIEARLEATHER